MFKPVYRITPFLMSCLEEIAAQNVFIERSGLKASLKISVSRDSFNRSVHSSTWIEGNQLSLAQVASLASHQDVNAQKSQKREVQDCIKALRWILKNKKYPLTESRLLKLHALMTAETLSVERSGQYREIQNYIVNAKNQVIFTPTAPAKVKQRMKDLFVWLSQNSNEHPIIRSALFHHEFVSIHPFIDGNGRVTRAASQWILLHAGYDAIWTLELDEFFAQDRAKYYDMIQQTRDMDGDYTHWIEYIAQGLLESIQIIVGRLKKSVHKDKNISLTPKQNELLALIERNGVVGSLQICEQMKINRARVNQLIAPMVKSGIVIKEGSTRGVRYRVG